jgi:hypothetical protein
VEPANCEPTTLRVTGGAGGEDHGIAWPIASRRGLGRGRRGGGGMPTVIVEGGGGTRGGGSGGGCGAGGRPWLSADGLW